MGLIDINTEPSRRDLRWFGVVVLAFFGFVGGMVLWRTGSWRVATWLWSIGGGASLVYSLAPSLRKPMFVGWMYAVYPIGWTVSHLLLGAIYYGVVAPIGALLRLFGHDPMERRFDAGKTSYWTPRPSSTDAERYFRQF